LLAWTTLAVVLLAVALPFITPAAHLFGFVAMPAAMVVALLAIVLAYVTATEAAKHWFWFGAR
jgi:P-type Mg2+ transporter